MNGESNSAGNKYTAHKANITPEISVLVFLSEIKQRVSNGDNDWKQKEFHFLLAK